MHTLCTCEYGDSLLSWVTHVPYVCSYSQKFLSVKNFEFGNANVWYMYVLYRWKFLMEAMFETFENPIIFQKIKFQKACSTESPAQLTSIF